MSQTIDSKVVEMKFDNSNFESNVSQSMSTLDRLKAALSFNGATDGLEKVNQAAKDVDMASLGDSVDQVGVKFSALQVVATTALANISNSLVNTAKGAVSSVISAVGEGGLTRALNLEQAQFMFEGLGVDVETAMESCNEAVTETAYSLDQAAMAASQFAASGMEAGDDMTSALRGIAGVAAMTGSEYSDIAQIFTTVAGNGRLMSEQLLQFSYRGINAAATLADELGVTEAQVREMVTAGEIDFETFYKAMDNAFGQHAKDANQTFTGALQNMKAAAARIGADFYTPVLESSRDLINTFTPVIDKIRSGLSPAIEGMTVAVDSLFNKLEDLLNNLDIEAFFKGFYKTFSLSDESAKDLSNTLSGLESLLGLLAGAFNVVISAASGLYSIVAPAFLKISGTIGNLITDVYQFTKTWGLFENVSKSVGYILDTLKSSLGEIWDAISSKFNLTGFFRSILGELNVFGSSSDEIFRNVTVTIRGAIVKIKDAIIGLIDIIPDDLGANALNGFSNLLDFAREKVQQLVKAVSNLKIFQAVGHIFSDITSGLSNLGSEIGSAISSLTSSSFFEFIRTLGSAAVTSIGEVFKIIGNAISSVANGLLGLDFSGVIDLLNSISFAGLSTTLAELGSVFKDPMKSLSNALFGSLQGSGGKGTFKDVLNSLKNSLKEFQNELKAEKLKQIAIAVGILAASLYALGKIDSDKLGGAIAAMGGLMGELVAAMAGIKAVDFKGSTKTFTSMILLAAAISILAGACKSLAGLNFEELATGLAGVGALLAGVYEFLNASSKGKGVLSQGTIKSATSMILMAAAIKILASVAKDLSSLNFEELATGLSGVAALLASMDIFIKEGKFDGKEMISTGLGIIEIAAAMKIFASACGDFGNLDIDVFAKGLGAMEAMLGGLIAFTKFGGSSDGMISMGLGIIEIAAAMKIFASACGDFGSLNPDELALGLSGMAAALAAVDIAMNKMYGDLGDATSFVVVAAALEILVNVVSKLAGMDLGAMAQGLVGMGIALAEVVVALNMLYGDLGDAAALMLVATALTVLCIPLKILGGMSLSEIANALIALAGAFIVIGVAGAALSGLTLDIIALSAAITLLGVGIAAIGGGVALLGVGLTSIAAAGVAAAEALGLAVTSIATSVVKLLPTLATELAQSIIQFVETIGEGVGTIGEALKNIVLTSLDVLTECAPQIAESIMSLLVQALSLLDQYGSQIADSLISFLVDIINTVANRIPDLGGAIGNLVSALFGEIANAFSSADSGMIENAILTIGAIAALILACDKLKSMVPGAMAGLVEVGVFVAELSGVLAALGALNQIPGLDWLISEGGNLLEKVGTSIGQMVGGLIGGIAQGITSSLPAMATDLSNFMTNLQPFLSAASSIDPGIGESIGSLAAAILLLTGADLINGITSFFGLGNSSLSKFGQELSEFAPYLKAFGDAMAGVDINAISQSADAISALVGIANAIPNEGGLLSKITGDNSLASFGKELAQFAPSLVAYSAAVSGISADSISGSVDAIKELVSIADAIPSSGGLLGFLGGSNDFGEFGRQLAALAPGLKTYAESVQDITLDSVSGSVEALKALCELSDLTFPDFATNGFEAFIEGTTDISKLKDIGTALKDYYNEISGVNVSEISQSVTELKSLSEAVSSISSMDTSGIKSFVDGLNELGKVSIDGFVDSISGAGPKIKSAVNEMMSAFTTSIDSSSVQSSVSSAFSSAIQGGLTAISKQSKSFISAGQELVSNISSGITAKKSDVINAITKLMTEALNAIKKKNSDFKKAGTDLIKNMIDGMNSKKTAVYNAGSSIASNGAKGANSKQSSFSQAGRNAGSGFVSGIKAYYQSAYNAGYGLASRGKSGVDAGQQSNSPAKELIKRGRYFGEGYAIGISRSTSTVLGSVDKMVSSSLSIVSAAVSKISDVIDSDMDVNPTITPVMDLSNVQYGASQISTLLGGNQALGFAMGSAGWISGSMNSRTSRNDTEGELLHAIKGLSKSLSNQEPRTVNNINGITYDDGSEVSAAIETLVHAAKVSGRT